MRLGQADAYVWWVAAMTAAAAATALKARGDSSDGLKKMTFKAPDLNAEESHGRFLPDHLKCDACQAIAHQFYSKYKEFNDLHKHYQFQLPESEVLDLTENICTVETFDRYGLKTVDGINRLTGPGIETEGVPGMIAGGGKWPGRLAEMCASLVELLGEETIYGTFRKSPNKEEKLRDLLCYGPGATGSCHVPNNFKTEL